ncbi:hypothetical protein A2Y83_00230 [Candidatus Falkowbacteria bacterium RBG_13_39_14]|uniref:Uncharacterized protein n=1 Tax=Candidatus Falkowbacteria bacterium RBG_13_39_14 TaxID=1797985 RepID=A0A1F5S4G4_9BACT|nr:MAG: hypothetical protein A2Y83_00230 [Candidatus Falkowbacteria bacterium RBG_13_39_14]
MKFCIFNNNNKKLRKVKKSYPQVKTPRYPAPREERDGTCEYKLSLRHIAQRSSMRGCHSPQI